MSTFLTDLHFAFRTMFRRPLVAAIAVLALALAIGSTTTVFALVNGILLAPLPFPNAEELAILYARHPLVEGGRSDLLVPPAFLHYVREHAQSFQTVGGMIGRAVDVVNTGSEQQETHTMLRVSANLFALLGANPVLGRHFLPEEDFAGTEPVTIISHRVWEQLFDGDPSAIDRTVVLEGVAYRVVGVMPKEFSLPVELLTGEDFAEAWGLELKDADVWMPLAMNQESWQDWKGQSLVAVARMKPGITLGEARAEIEALMARTVKEHYAEAEGVSASAMSWVARITRKAHPTLLVLSFASALVVLAACANVASLLLGRATERRKEFALRCALGASPARIIRQCITEGAVLGVMASALGILMAWVAVRVSVAALPAKLPRIEEVRIDGTVLVFAIGFSILVGILSSLVPALSSTRVNLHDTLKEGGGTGATMSARSRLQNVLVCSEIALAMAVLVGSALLTRTFVRLHNLDVGFNPDNVLVTSQIWLIRHGAEERYPTDAHKLAFAEEIERRVRRLPGVQSVAVAGRVPLREHFAGNTTVIEGRPGTEMVRYLPVGTDYLDVMQIPLVKGRFFDARDTAEAMPVCVVNETLARAYFSGRDPLNGRVKKGSQEMDVPWHTIVGVVADSKNRTIDGPPDPTVYCPEAQFTASLISLHVRASDNPGRLATAIRDEIKGVDPEIRLDSVKPLADIVEDKASTSRFAAAVGMAFGVIVLVLAGTGTYGVMAHWVESHLRDLGIRAALGARPRDIFAHVLGRGARLLLAGAVLGMIMGLLGNLFLASRIYVYNLSPRDWPSFILAFLLLAAITIVACVLTARRAANLDPMDVLRCE